MGQSSSIEGVKLQALVQKLTKLELSDLENVFHELSTTSDSGESVIKQPTWLNRDKFAEIFGTNELIVEQLFEIFDQDHNGIVDMQEFISGMALCLHGSIKDKCRLMFKIFNLDGDEGVSREELSTILTSCLQSAHSLLVKTLKVEGIQFSEEETNTRESQSDAIMVSVVVDKIVKDAFSKCDVSGNGKLEVDEFAIWVHKNPKLVNNLFVLQCPKPSQASSVPSMPRDSVQSSISSYSIVQAEEEGEEVFMDPELQEQQNVSDTEPGTLLSQSLKHQAENKQTTLQDLFSTPENASQQQSFFDSLSTNQQPETSEQKTFFDSISTNQQSESVNSSLSRPSSEQFLTSNLIESKDILGGSERHIESYGTSLVPKHLQNIAGSNSLQSITLSQDSLSEGKDSSGEFLTSENIEETSAQNIRNENEVSEKTWHPLQGGQGEVSQIDVSQESPEVQQHVTTAPDKVHDNEVIDDRHENEDMNHDISVASAVQVSEPSSDSYEMGVEPSLEEVEEIPHDSKQKLYAYWPPTRKTEQLLNDVRLGKHMDEKNLTFPSVLIEGIMGDPVKELVSKYLGDQEASKRPFPTSDSVEMNESGLKQLLTHGCWRGAIDFTANFLAIHGLGLDQNQHTLNQKRVMLTPSLLQVWFVRIALLVKMRMFSQAEAEFNAFNELDGPDLYFEFYQNLYHGKKGSMVPFSLRLLYAELPQHNGRPNVALDRLYALQRIVTTIRNNLSNGLLEDGSPNGCYSDEEVEEIQRTWNARHLRLQYALGNCFLGMKEYNLAVRLYKGIVKLEPKRALSVLSAIGRIYLQVGDLSTATKYFRKADKLNPSDQKEKSVLALNKGYLHLSESNYEDAYQFFTMAANQDKENLAAVNNAAVCLLFLGKLKEASNLLERMVWEFPQRSLHQDILFNLNTIYELETSRALQKKYKLLDLVSKNKGDGFFTQCLKLT